MKLHLLMQQKPFNFRIERSELFKTFNADLLKALFPDSNIDNSRDCTLMWKHLIWRNLGSYWNLGRKPVKMISPSDSKMVFLRLWNSRQTCKNQCATYFLFSECENNKCTRIAGHSTVSYLILFLFKILDAFIQNKQLDTIYLDF